MTKIDAALRYRFRRMLSSHLVQLYDVIAEMMQMGVTPNRSNIILADFVVRTLGLHGSVTIEQFVAEYNKVKGRLNRDRFRKPPKRRRVYRTPPS